MTGAPLIPRSAKIRSTSESGQDGSTVVISRRITSCACRRAQRAAPGAGARPERSGAGVPGAGSRRGGGHTRWGWVMVVLLANDPARSVPNAGLGSAAEDVREMAALRGGPQPPADGPAG